MKKMILLGAVFGAGILVYNCGGGGGSAGSGTVSLYFTDDPGNTFPVVEITVYEVNLCKDPVCTEKVNLFQDQNGITVDLTNLNGVLQYIDTASVPPGNYPRLEVVISQNANVCDNGGTCNDAIFTEMDEKPTKPNVVNCPPGYVDNNGQQLCYIRYTGAKEPLVISPTSDKLILDFNLKDFEIDTTQTPWNITEVKVSPITPAGVHEKYEIYATVQNVDPNANSLSVDWRGDAYTVNITDTTRCEVMDVNYYGSDCLNQIQSGMCIEIKTLEDPATIDALTAKEIEVKSGSKCSGKGSKEEYKKAHEIKGYVSNIDTTNNSFDVDGITVTVIDSTFCEYNEIYYQGIECLNNLQEGWKVEVKINQNNEALKIERED